MRILTVVGARPQFIKAAPVHRAIHATQGALTEYLVHTGQHYDDNMSRTFFEQLALPTPDENLEIGSASHGVQTGRMLDALDRVLAEQRPDMVLVYGDTNSTLAGALAAAKYGIPVGHVEAGLRSYRRDMPEEINRVVADRLSTWLFCPTATAVRNLAREGMSAGVHLVGDVMYDAFLTYRRAADDAPVLSGLGLGPGTYNVLTIHRAENTAQVEPLLEVLQALGAREEITVFPVHPRTRKLLGNAADGAMGNLRLIDPVPYLTMLALQANARVILTDSGGVQKEAYWSRVPCLTLREETEWVETLEGGWNRLVRFEHTAVTEALDVLAHTAPDSEAAASGYGDGRAAECIVDCVRGVTS